MSKILVGGISEEGNRLLSKYIDKFIPDIIIEPLRQSGIKSKMKNHAKRSEVIMVIIDDALYQQCIGVADEVLQLPKVHRYIDDDGLKQFLISKFGKLDGDTTSAFPSTPMHNEPIEVTETIVEETPRQSEPSYVPVVEDDNTSLIVTQELSEDLERKLRTDIATRDGIIENLKNQIKELTADEDDDDFSAVYQRISELESELSDKNKEISELISKSNSVDEKLQRAESVISEIDSLRAKISEERENSSALLHEKTTLEEKLQSSSSKVSELEAEIERLKVFELNAGDLSDISEKYSACLHNLNTISNQKENLEFEIRSKDSQIATLQMQVADRGVLEDRIKELTDKCDNSSLKISELSEKCSTSESRNKDLTEQLDNSAIKINDLSGRCETLNSKVKEVTEQLSNSEAKNIELISKCESSSEKIRELTEKCDGSAIQLREMSDKYESSVSELTELQEKYKGSVSELADLQEKYSCSVGQYKELNEKLSFTNLELESLREQYNNSLSELSNLKERYGASTSQVKEISEKSVSQIKDLTEKYMKSDSQVRELTEKCKQSDFQVSELTNKCSSYDSQIKDLSEKLRQSDSQVRELTEQCDYYESQVKSANDKYSNLVIKFDDVSTKLTTSNSKVRDLESQLSNESTSSELVGKLTQDLESVKREKAQLESKIGVLTSQLESNEQDSELVNSLNVELDILRKEKSSFDETINSLKAQLKSSEKDSEGFIKRNEDLESQLTELKCSIARLESEKKSLQTDLSKARDTSDKDRDLANLRIEVTKLQSELKLRSEETKSSNEGNSKKLKEMELMLSTIREKLAKTEVENFEKEEQLKELRDNVFIKMADYALPKITVPLSLPMPFDTYPNMYTLASGSAESCVSTYQMIRRMVSADSTRTYLFVDLVTDTYVDRELGVRSIKSPSPWLQGSEPVDEFIAETKFENVKVISTALAYMNDLYLLMVDWKKRLEEIKDKADIIILNVGSLDNVIHNTLFNSFSNITRCHVIVKATPINLRTTLLHLLGFSQLKNTLISCVNMEEESQQLYQKLANKFPTQLLSGNDVLSLEMR